MTQIGRTMGWPDQNYFARRFRAHYGSTPRPAASSSTHTTARLRTWLADGTATPN